MNLKCKVIFNVDIVYFLIIHVVYSNENYNKSYEWITKNNEFIMEFWNDDIVFVTQRKWKMWIQKVCHNNVKIKIKKYNTFKWKI